MHTCPDCGQACSCAGDIEDHDTGDEFYDECYHCDGADLPDDDDGFEPGRIDAAPVNYSATAVSDQKDAGARDAS